MNVYKNIEKMLDKNKYKFVCWYVETDNKNINEYAKDNNISVDDVKEYLTDDEVQNAIKMLMSAKHTEKMINIYNKFYEQALSGDVQSARFLIDFSKQFFEDDKEDELVSLLNNVEIGDGND